VTFEKAKEDLRLLQLDSMQKMDVISLLVCDFDLHLCFCMVTCHFSMFTHTDGQDSPGVMATKTLVN